MEQLTKTEKEYVIDALVSFRHGVKLGQAWSSHFIGERLAYLREIDDAIPGIRQRLDNPGQLTERDLEDIADALMSLERLDDTMKSIEQKLPLPTLPSAHSSPEDLKEYYARAAAEGWVGSPNYWVRAEN